MKELKEYKAEIFRRSEEIILKRIENKKRRTKIIFSLCVPLCLTVIISSSLILSLFINDSSDGYEESSVIGDANGATSADSTVQSYLYADVYFGDESKINRIDDPEKINELSELIRCAYADSYLYYDISDRANVIKDDGSDNIDDEIPELALESIEEERKICTITLTASDGYQKTIIIDGNNICDPELDIDVTLKENRLEELKTFLGLND